MQGAFFFKTGDTVAGSGAGPGRELARSSSSSSSKGGYNYPN